MPDLFETWRKQARLALSQGTEPALFGLSTGPSLFDSATATSSQNSLTFAVPKDFILLAEAVILHSSAQKEALLYRVLWRVTRGGESHLLKLVTDPDVRALQLMQKDIRKDIHKMLAFLRFQSVKCAEGKESLQAWYEPDHFILGRTASFFKERFGNLPWEITTPSEKATWDLKHLLIQQGRFVKPETDNEDFEELWRSYYKSTHNPARMNVKKLKLEMPTRFWKNLPEAKEIHSLLQNSGGSRQTETTLHPATASSIGSLTDLGQVLKSCRHCELCEPATQVVEGEGSPLSRIMILGEQPGDHEDQQGRPFVGPAGQLLREQLEYLNIDQSQLYFTNAVKHFRFTQQGKQRIHKSPQSSHISLCRPWLHKELELLSTRYVIALGNTAAQSVLGYPVRITESRGKIYKGPLDTRVLVTYHPSYILRSTTPELRLSRERQFQEDLLKTREWFS